MLLLTKILTLLVYPLSLGLILLLLSVLAGAAGRRGFSWLMGFMSLIVVYVPSTEFGAAALMEGLEGRYPAFAPEELPQADAIVVLGGGINGESRFGRGGDLNEAADRVFAAAELYMARKAPVILLSGGSPEPGRPEADLMAAKLIALGIPDSALMRETASRTTADNARYAAEILKNGSMSHILLVTSGAHMRRAIALFEREGLQITAASTDHQTPRFKPFVPGWLPRVDALGRSTRAIHEWVGYWAYSVMGRL